MPLPSRLRSRARLVLFWLGLLYFLSPSALLAFFSPGAAHAGAHPIDRLITDAQGRWERKVRAQSKGLGEAVREYRRRYGRPPPKGFDEWFAFAQEADFKLIDEFDAIDEDLSLFRLLSSAELRKRTYAAFEQETAFGVVLAAGQARIVADVVHGGVKRGDKGRAVGFAKMLEPWAGRLPDLAFALTGLAEAMVLPPWEKTQPHNLTLEIPDVKPFVTERNGYAMWHKFTNTCHPASPVRIDPERYQWPIASAIRPPTVGEDPAQLAPGGESTLDLGDALQTRGMQFLERTEAHVDLCNVAPDRFYEYGAIYTGWPAFTELYPVFGPGQSQGAREIRIPSNYYYRTDSYKYTYGLNRETGLVEEENPRDPKWEEKRDTIYWRGSTTGGGNSPAGRYAYFPRHRFVQLAGQTSNRSMALVHRTPAAAYKASVVSVEDLRQAVLDVSFSHALQCKLYPGGCAQMEADYAFSDWAALDDAYRAKMVFDIDGMGYSARFLALLASRSAPVKATIYREFFEDWLEPWVHYIPASTHYQELFNIWAYFLGDSTPKGDAALRRIAEDSREAKFSQLRQVDLEDVARLALEWARLWYKDERNMDYHHETP